MAPLDLTIPWGTTLSYIIPLLIGFGFGSVLEASGFGDSRKLAAQFYLTDMTVLKVMFTAIIVAAVLLTVSASFGLIDLERVYVNETYLWPGIVGGLIMGVGFVIGGFCPGTSLVAASTLKIDGLVFLLGVSIGVFAFGESVTLFEGFWLSSDLGRFTLPELFDVDASVVVTGIVLMALFMFLLGELSEAFFGRKQAPQSLRFFPRRPMAWASMGLLVAVALIATVKGQPDLELRWQRMAEEKGAKLTSRAVYVHPMEVAELTQDTAVFTRILDVRSEAHHNLFHLRKSEHTSLEQLSDPAFVKELKKAPGNTVVFTVSNDDERATAAWKLLAAQGVSNIYIIDGGINAWLKLFPPPPCLAKPHERKRAPEQLAFDFRRAVGDCCNQAYPDVKHKKLPFDCYLSTHGSDTSRSKAGTHEAPEPKVAFKHKVKLKKKAAVKGGCG